MDGDVYKEIRNKDKKIKYRFHDVIFRADDAESRVRSLRVRGLFFQSRIRDSIRYSIDQSVRPSVHPSLHPSVRLSVTLLKFSPKSYLNHITAPAHPYATDAVVYTALFRVRFLF